MSLRDFIPVEYVMMLATPYAVVLGPEVCLTAVGTLIPGPVGYLWRQGKRLGAGAAPTDLCALAVDAIEEPASNG